MYQAYMEYLKIFNILLSIKGWHMLIYKIDFFFTKQVLVKHYISIHMYHIEWLYP